MNIKESYQYQNFLSELFYKTVSYLNKDYTTKTVKKHLRSAAGGDDVVQDETVERPFRDIPVDTLILFALALIEEQEKLGIAIMEAKQETCCSWKQSPIHLDAELSSNKLRHSLISQLECIAAIQPRAVVKTRGTDYKFNNEGNQIPYVYPLEETTEIDFDRTKLRSTIKILKKTASGKSMSAEKAIIQTEVTFTPQFDIDDSYLDALKTFAAKMTLCN